MNPTKGEKLKGFTLAKIRHSRETPQDMKLGMHPGNFTSFNGHFMVRVKPYFGHFRVIFPFLQSWLDKFLVFYRTEMGI